MSLLGSLGPYPAGLGPYKGPYPIVGDRVEIATVCREWLSDEERATLSPAALLALESGSEAAAYVDELRRIIGARFL
jgi:hypothetical protein